MMSDYLELHGQFDPPFESFDNRMLGADFPRELALVSRLWFACGYRPGIAAYLNFFLLRDFIILHDTAHPPRFATFRSMADSFYRTDLFIRDVTDSGRTPTGGISSAKVRATLQSIMRRHRHISIPGWMMTCFGFSLTEMVEKQCEPLTDTDRQLHLSYMNKAFRIMGVPFTERREWLEQFSRDIEARQAGLADNVEKHLRNILLLGEMVGVSSERAALGAMLPERTRAIFDAVYERVRLGPARRLGARWLGGALMRRAVGAPRVAVPVVE